MNESPKTSFVASKVSFMLRCNSYSRSRFSMSEKIFFSLQSSMLTNGLKACFQAEKSKMMFDGHNNKFFLFRFSCYIASSFTRILKTSDMNWPT